MYNTIFAQVTTDVKPFWDVIIDGVASIAAFFKSVGDVLSLIIELILNIFEFGSSLIDSFMRLPNTLTIPIAIILYLTILVVCLNIIKKIPLA